MNILNLFTPSLGEFFWLAILTAIGVSMAFMVIGMASGLESFVLYEAGLDSQGNAIPNALIAESSATNGP